ncbi:copper resistance D family protein [Trinickia symbiotica]|nr:CopD family protein [Trinickia symbiotica]
MFASIMAAAANMSFAFAVGACLIGLMLHGASPLTRGGLRWFAIVGVAILIVADVANLVLEAALMSGSALRVAFALIVPVLTESHFGAAWLSGFVALIVWAGLLAVSPWFGRPAPMSVALLAAAVFAFSKAASSHAADAGDFAMPEWIHWVHLCATAAWAGLVIASGYSILPTLRAASPGEALSRFVGQLSRVALVAFSLVIVTGIYNADRGLGGSLAPLGRSEWGIILDVKLVLVAVATVLGGVNRYVYLPRIRGNVGGGATNSFLIILRAEAIAMLGALSAAAVLAHIAPGTYPGALP